MIEERVLGPKGQIVIPKTIREHLGLKRGSRVVFEFNEGELVLKPQKSPEQFVEEFCSTVKKKLNRKVPLDELYGDEAIERFQT